MTHIVNFEAQWDAEAEVWWAQSSGPEGIVTEAPTVEALRERLRLIVPDYLEADDQLSGKKSGDVTINLTFSVSDVIKAA
jgi:Domain of unknown function (DUF1902)